MRQTKFSPQRKNRPFLSLPNEINDSVLLFTAFLVPQRFGTRINI